MKRDLRSNLIRCLLETGASTFFPRTTSIISFLLNITTRSYISHEAGYGAEPQGLRFGFAVGKKPPNFGFMKIKNVFDTVIDIYVPEVRSEVVRSPLQNDFTWVHVQFALYFFKKMTWYNRFTS